MIFEALEVKMLQDMRSEVNVISLCELVTENLDSVLKSAAPNVFEVMSLLTRRGEEGIFWERNLEVLSQNFSFEELDCSSKNPKDDEALCFWSQKLSSLEGVNLSAHQTC